MEVINRFSGLYLVDRVTELWVEVHNIVQEVANKTITKKKKSKKDKWLSEEALQIAKKRREAKSEGESEKYSAKHKFPKNSTERQEGLLQ